MLARRRRSDCTTVLVLSGFNEPENKNINLQHKFLFSSFIFFLLLQHQTPFPNSAFFLVLCKHNKKIQAANLCSLHVYRISVGTKTKSEKRNNSSICCRSICRTRISIHKCIRMMVNGSSWSLIRRRFMLQRRRAPFCSRSDPIASLSLRDEPKMKSRVTSSGLEGILKAINNKVKALLQHVNRLN